MALVYTITDRQKDIHLYYTRSEVSCKAMGQSVASTCGMVHFSLVINCKAYGFVCSQNY